MSKSSEFILVLLGGPLSAVIAAGLLRIPGVTVQPSAVLGLIAAALFVWDAMLQRRNDTFADDLFEYVTDIGEAMSRGAGVETALQQVTNHRGGAVGAVMQRVLQASADTPLEAALTEEAKNLGDSTFKEVASLLGMMVGLDGNTGDTIKRLGKRLSELRAAERRNQRALVDATWVLVMGSLVLVPLCGTFLVNLGTNAALMDIEYRYFGTVALGVGFLQWTVFGSLHRFLARLPAYLMLVYGGITGVQIAFGFLPSSTISLF